MHRAGAMRLALAAGTIALCSAATVPAGILPSVTDRSITFVHDGAVYSTALICPGYAFDHFGKTGPLFSPDDHWVLVDVMGPFTPGNVPRTQALVEVRTGGVVLAPNFPTYLGVPATSRPIGWASGERATLAFENGKSAVIHDPPLRPIPPVTCAPGTPKPGATASAS